MPTSHTWDGRVEQKFVVEYTLNDTTSAETLLSEDHFVHFFPTDTLTSFPRHIVFVIDISGSMGGIAKIFLIRLGLVKLGKVRHVIQDYLEWKRTMKSLPFSIFKVIGFNFYDINMV